MSRLLKILPSVVAGLKQPTIDFLKKPIQEKLQSLGVKPSNPFDLESVAEIGTTNARGLLAFVESIFPACEADSDDTKAKCEAKISALQSMAATMGIEVEETTDVKVAVVEPEVVEPEVVEPKTVVEPEPIIESEAETTVESEATVEPTVSEPTDSPEDAAQIVTQKPQRKRKTK
jgi:hypothetical protein